jgi:hypothetical protein
MNDEGVPNADALRQWAEAWEAAEQQWEETMERTERDNRCLEEERIADESTRHRDNATGLSPNLG